MSNTLILTVNVLLVINLGCYAVCFVEYVFCYADGVLFVMHQAVVSLLVLRGGIEVADLLPVEDVVTVLK